MLHSTARLWLHAERLMFQAISLLADLMAVHEFRCNHAPFRQPFDKDGVRLFLLVCLTKSSLKISLLLSFLFPNRTRELGVLMLFKSVSSFPFNEGLEAFIVDEN